MTYRLMSLHFKKIRAETTASNSFDFICRVRVAHEYEYIACEYRVPSTTSLLAILL